MKPDRELDSKIAREVFKHEVVQHKSLGRSDYYYKSGKDLILVPTYSTHIANAWLIVDSMTRAFHFSLRCDHHQGWRAGFTVGEIQEWSEETFTSESAAHAICLAALQVIASYLPAAGPSS